MTKFEGMHTKFTKDLEIDFPIIMAPMFLVSNQEMVVSAMESGILGTFPTLNYRKNEELEAAMVAMNATKAELKVKGNWGVNLIVQKTNPKMKDHLALCIKHKVPFYITSLGNPKDVIDAAHGYGGKVYCDVTNLEHAKKVVEQGCDGLVAVGQGAGGHAGPNPLHVLVPSLKRAFPAMPVIAAGGIAHGEALASMLAAGASGVSVGTRFIASKEAGVNDGYKNAVVDAKMKDIVMTTKLSGTPCAIIDTPYAKKIGYSQNWLERYLSTNKQTRKYFKMWVQYTGMKKLEKSVLPANYNTLWSAGHSVEMISEIQPIHQIVTELKAETKEAIQALMGTLD